MMKDPGERMLYEIDFADRIVFVGDEWDQFAVAGDAAELVQPNVLGNLLWDYIYGDMTTTIYKQMLVAVRSGRPVFLDFRCDSPSQARYLEMRISSIDDGGVRFETFTKRVEDRAPESIFTPNQLCSECIITSCSWCKKIRTEPREWHEIEKAIELLHLFDLDPIPNLSHGICETCLADLTKNL